MEYENRECLGAGRNRGGERDLGPRRYLHRVKKGAAGDVQDAFAFCDGGGGCALVQNSAWGWFLGVDVALIGALGYAAIFRGGRGRAPTRLGDRPVADHRADGADLSRGRFSPPD